MAISDSDVKKAVKHLRGSDPIMAALIRRVGPFRLKLHRHRFRTVVGAIIAQQISVAAARTIQKRVCDLVGTKVITAQRLAAVDLPSLRAAGVSQQKAGYLLDLADKTLKGNVPFAKFSRMTDQQIIDILTQVKGIGRWTAEMFLIFCLGRLNVFPYDDLGIRNALQKLYGLEELPNRETGQRIAEPWRPYASVASWYCWRSLELDS